MADAPDRETEFDRMWETLEIRETLEFEGPTETVRATTQLVDADGASEVEDLPLLTGAAERAESDQIDLRETIGEGGMGEVRLARQIPLDREVAVKLLRGDGDVDDRAVEALLRESWVTGRLEHPNIVPVHTLGRNEAGEPMLVLKKVEGISWAELLEDPSKSPRNFDSDDPLDWHLEILSDVCDAVHFAHSQGVIHRDIKPENVMIGAFGEVYLLDWGIAVSIDSDPGGRLPSVGDVTEPAGTPAYMAPEMTTGEGASLSKRTDIYLLGATLHEVVTGSPPHDGESFRDILLAAYTAEAPEYGDAVDPDLASICRRAMAPDPDDRFESAEELRRAVVRHRNRRESIRISRDAERRLGELRDAIERDAPEGKIYEAFGESRFGFEQALRVSEDNEAAREGLQQSLELMAEQELDRGAADAAALLIEDLPEPRPDLERRLAALQEELESREREFEKLRRERREEDVDVARHARSITALILGVIWLITNPKFPDLARLLGLEPNATTYLWFAAPVTVAVGCAGFAMRDRILKNRANRQIAIGTGAIIFWGLVVRLLGVVLELDVAAVVPLEMASYAAGGTVAAATIDRRVGWAVLPVFVGPFVAAAWPASIFWVFGLASFASMLVLAWVWWPDDG